MAGSCRVIDEFAKDNLLGRLRRDRRALLWKLDDLSEYDARRPLTETGTNLLGLVKHVATVEARYFGEVFDRPYPEPLPRWQDYDGSDLWATEDETRDQIIGFYRRAWEHSDATINELPLDAPGHVPWWPEPYPNTNLFAIMLHVLGEAIRHAGHADILREGLDGRTGLRVENEKRIDEEARAAYFARIEQAARSAGSRECTYRRPGCGTMHMQEGPLVDEGPIDVIRLEGEGNSVILRLTGRERPDGQDAGDALTGEFLVDTPFVRGSLKTWVLPDDLRHWQEALDALDAGQDIAWRENTRGPEVFIERDLEEERAHVTIRDASSSLTTVTVTVPLVDAWFDDAYSRLDRAWRTWHLTNDGQGSPSAIVDATVDSPGSS